MTHNIHELRPSRLLCRAEYIKQTNHKNRQKFAHQKKRRKKTEKDPKGKKNLKRNIDA
jgi:hypothetical protein